MSRFTQSLFSHVRNHGLFSSHWFENRFDREPDWEEAAEASKASLTSLTTLWKTQSKRVEKYGDEQGLEEAFIQPVLEAVGWKLKYQTHLRGRKPDYALFLSDAHLDTALDFKREDPDFWVPSAVVADAKKWDYPLDKKVGSGAKKEYPPEQIEWYLTHSRKPFGILTNGRLWRLVPRELGPTQRRFQTFLEIDLARSSTTHPRRAESTSTPKRISGPCSYFSGRPVSRRRTAGNRSHNGRWKAVPTTGSV